MYEFMYELKCCSCTLHSQHLVSNVTRGIMAHEK